MIDVSTNKPSELCAHTYRLSTHIQSSEIVHPQYQVFSRRAVNSIPDNTEHIRFSSKHVSVLNTKLFLTFRTNMQCSIYTEH